MSPEEIVKIAAELIAALPAAEEQALKEALIGRGIPPFIADQVMVLVPLAFSRAHFDGASFEKQYWDYFLLIDRRTGKEEKHRLEWNPFYGAAKAQAQMLSVGGPQECDLLKSVAQRSYEYQAIDTVFSNLPPGAVVEAVGSSPPTVLTDFPESGAAEKLCS
jgi:hypothetical protein